MFSHSGAHTAYGKAYSRGMSVSVKQHREGWSFSASAPPLFALPPADIPRPNTTTEFGCGGTRCVADGVKVCYPQLPCCCCCSSRSNSNSSKLPHLYTSRNNETYTERVQTFAADNGGKALTSVHAPAGHCWNVQPLSDVHKPAISNAKKHLQHQMHATDHFHRVNDRLIWDFCSYTRHLLTMCHVLLLFWPHFVIFHSSDFRTIVYLSN